MEHMCVFLVRHGQTDWNVEGRLQGRRGVGLNEVGRRQAAAVARVLKEKQMVAVYASPLERTVETARIIVEDLEPILVDGLVERDHGDWEGLTLSDIDKRFPERVEAQRRLGIDWQFPRGESGRQVFERVVAAFKEIIHRHTLGEHVVIVSHGATLRALVHWLHGGKPEDLLHTSRLDNAELVEVHWNEKAVRIMRYVEHLSDLDL